MSDRSHRRTLLNIPLIEEKFGRSFLASVCIHVAVVLLFLFGSYLLPQAAIQIGSGIGGGIGGSTYTVGVVDELGGGIGMTKPSLTPKPPALVEKKLKKEEPKAIPLPEAIDPEKPSKKSSSQTASVTKKPVPLPESNVIPTAPEPGAGGTGGMAGGSGGGRGGGEGVSIGLGAGGLGGSWYARAVEARISSNWVRPPEGVSVEIVYNFYIAANGTIYDIRKIKSSGNPEMDLMAERAIRVSGPLSPPPLEFRERPIQFEAQFIYPPNR